MSTLKISRENFPSRLFQNDVNHIKRKIKEKGFDDTRFKDKSASIRYYVHLGVITEKRTETANTLDDRIIKASQKEVVADSLKPLKMSIDDLINIVENLDQKQTDFFVQSNRNFEALLRRFESLFELLNEQLGDITKQLLKTGRVNEESLRNALILRTVMFVFLIGYKTGRIDPNLEADWNGIIRKTIAHARTFSIEQIAQITAEDSDNKIIEDLGREMWKSIRSFFPKPPNK